MQFWFTPKKTTINDAFVLRRLQEYSHGNGILVLCIFFRFRKSRKVLEWAARNKGIQEVLARSLMNTYVGAIVWWLSFWLVNH